MAVSGGKISVTSGSVICIDSAKVTVSGGSASSTANYAIYAGDNTIMDVSGSVVRGTVSVFIFPNSS
ncbi:MAG: hypothetical protein AB7C97_03515 [Oscillospiraceae bacterium]